MWEQIRKKAEHFWMYYKIQFGLILVAAVFIGYFGIAKLTEKDLAFQALLFDIHTDVRQEVLEKEFAEYAGISQKEQDVIVSTALLLADGTTNYAITSRAKFYSEIGVEKLDVITMLEPYFVDYTHADSFLDLREVFTEEELQQFPQLYVDASGKVLGIYVNDLPKMKSIEGYSGEDSAAVAGILYNSKKIETARKFLEFLLIP